MNENKNSQTETVDEKTEKFLGVKLTPKDAKKSKIGLGIAILIIILFVVFSERGYSDSRIMNIAEEFVLDDLPIGSTEFLGNREIIEISEDAWEVSGDVKALSNQGEIVNTRYYIELRYSKDTDMFYVNYIDYAYNQ